MDIEKFSKDLLDKETRNITNDEKTFLNFENNCLREFVSTECSKNLVNDKEYQELKNEVIRLKEENPKARAFIENEIVDCINKEEQQIIQDIMDLQVKMYNIEEREVFKLGMKEAICLLKTNNDYKRIFSK